MKGQLGIGRHLGFTLNDCEVLEVCVQVPAGALLGDACLLQRRQQLLYGCHIRLARRPDTLCSTMIRANPYYANVPG